MFLSAGCLLAFCSGSVSKQSARTGMNQLGGVSCPSGVGTSMLWSIGRIQLVYGYNCRNNLCDIIPDISPKLALPGN